MALQRGDPLSVLNLRKSCSAYCFISTFSPYLLGPYVVNGCPLRRVDQTYVIATKARVDISDINLPEKLDDSYFRREKKARKSKNEGDMFEKEDKVLLCCTFQHLRCVDNQA